MEYLIRPVTVADMPELLLMLAEHADYEKAVFDPTEKLDRLSKAIFDEPSRLFCEVVEKENQLYGFVTYTYDFSTWDAGEFMYMDCLFLRKSVRGQGIGTTIVAKLKSIAQKRKAINIQWQTPDFNVPAIRFYKKNGAASLDKVRFTLKV